jgi:hypothetical protein
MARLVLALAAAFILSFNASAQLREIPKEVKQAFESQYPAAQKAEYRDNLIDVHVVFYIDSIRMVAEYTNKGVWKETEKGYSESGDKRRICQKQICRLAGNRSYYY